MPSSIDQNNTEAERIIIFDTTLRDGEQCPGASMTLRQKVEIAHLLDEMGVDVIEAGFAASSEKERQSIGRICQSTVRATICSLSRCVPSDIRASAEALMGAIKQGRGRIHVFCATSDIHMAHKLEKKPIEVLRMIRDGVRYARKFTPDVEFSAEDAFRSNPDFLVKAVRVAIKAGASTINLPDTVGYGEPDEYKAFMQEMIKRVKAPKEVIFSGHCHNDLGMATANSLAGIKGGARQVECTINGLGERAGNAALEEIVMAINSHPQKYPSVAHIQTRMLTPISKVVSEASRFIVQKNKAIVGENAFAHGSGVHQDGMSKRADTYQIMSPEIVGQVGTMPITSHSGWKAVEVILSAQGIVVNGIDKVGVMAVIKKHAGRRKVVSDKRVTQLAVAFANRCHRVNGRAA